MTDVRVLTMPKVAGAYVVGGNLHIEIRNRPAWWHRAWTKFLLGWEWENRHESAKQEER